MKYSSDSIDEYIASLPEERIAAFKKLRKVVRENLPQGFEECISYGMPAFAVPHSLYPAGYHCKPEEPLPFISLGNQKNFIGLYHMGMYAFPEVGHWFEGEYKNLGIGKLDRGKSCIRFKKMDSIPFALIGSLCRRITVEEWIKMYETKLR